MIKIETTDEHIQYYKDVHSIKRIRKGLIDSKSTFMELLLMQKINFSKPWVIQSHGAYVLHAAVFPDFSPRVY